MTLSEIMAMHPAPWRHHANAGHVQVIDARNQEVVLFTLLDFATQVTAQLARRAQPAEASSS